MLKPTVFAMCDGHQVTEQRLPVAERRGEDHGHGLAAVGAGHGLDLVVPGGAGRLERLAAHVGELRVAAIRLPHVDEVGRVDRHAVGPDRLGVDLVHDRLRARARHLDAGHVVRVQLLLEGVRGDVDRRPDLVHDLLEHELVVGRLVDVEPGHVLVEGVRERPAALDSGRAGARAGCAAATATAAAARGQRGHACERQRKAAEDSLVFHRQPSLSTLLAPSARNWVIVCRPSCLCGYVTAGRNGRRHGSRYRRGPVTACCPEHPCESV